MPFVASTAEKLETNDANLSTFHRQTGTIDVRIQHFFFFAHLTAAFKIGLYFRFFPSHIESAVENMIYHRVCERASVHCNKMLPCYIICIIYLYFILVNSSSWKIVVAAAILGVDFSRHSLLSLSLCLPFPSETSHLIP